MKKNKKISLAFFFVSVLLTPLIYVYSRYWQIIELSPPKFVEEYIKFLGGLLSVFLAFYLVNVYWAGERGGKQSFQLRRLCLVHLESIILTCSKTKDIHNQLIEVKWPDGSWKELTEIDKTVLQNIEKLNSVFKEFIKMVGENGGNLTYDKQLEAELLKSIQDMSPIIQNLSVLQSTIPHKTTINSDLTNIINLASQVKGRLLLEPV